MSHEKWSQQLDIWGTVPNGMTMTIPLEMQAPLYYSVETGLLGEPFLPNLPSPDYSPTPKIDYRERL
jgi:hypothetical protein